VDALPIYVLTFNGTLGADARQGRFYRAVPIAYVWDDHDYGPNNSDRTHVGRAAAATVYREIVPHYPLHAGSGDAPIYQSWQIGRSEEHTSELQSRENLVFR